MQKMIQQILFAAIPIVVSCVAYLLNDLHAIKVRLEELQSKLALAKVEITQNMTEKFNEDALARSELDKRISIIESNIKSQEQDLRELKNSSPRSNSNNN